MSTIKVGDRFGSLVVSELSLGKRLSGKPKYLALAICDCGGSSLIERHNLTTGNTKQCQACARLSRGKSRLTHGNSMSFKDRDPIGYNCYTRWQSMKRRCHNETDKRYESYGGRGISISVEWVDSYETFLNDMGLPPTGKHQLDRRDNNGNYCKENCRWITPTDNARNKRNNRLIECNGQTKTMAEWAEISGIPYCTLKGRINRGVSPEIAMTKEKSGKYTYSTPSGDFASLSAVAKSFTMSISGVNGRFENASYTEWVKHERT